MAEQKRAKNGILYEKSGTDEWTPARKVSKDGTSYESDGLDSWKPVSTESAKQEAPGSVMTFINDAMDTASLDNLAEAKAGLDNPGDWKNTRDKYEAEMEVGRRENPTASMLGTTLGIAGPIAASMFTGGASMLPVSARLAKAFPSLAKSRSVIGAAVKGAESGLQRGLLSDLGSDRSMEDRATGAGVNALTSATLGAAMQKMGNGLYNRTFAPAQAVAKDKKFNVKPYDFLDEMGNPSGNPEKIRSQMEAKMRDLGVERSNLLNQGGGTPINVNQNSFPKTQDYISKMGIPSERNSATNEFIDLVQDWSQGPQTPARMEELRQQVQNKWKDDGGNMGAYARQLYGELRDMVANAAQDPQAVRAINSKRQALGELIKNQGKVIQKETKIPSFGLSDAMMMGTGLLGGSSRGDSPGASLINGLVLMGANKVAQRQAPSTFVGNIMKGIPSLERGIPADYSSMQNFWDIKRSD